MADHVITATPARDGAGVNINRIAGDEVHGLLDPFLMVDEIRSDDAQDYMAGFPPHPHRGFETITYLLKGNMTHQDHLGNRKTMTDGGVQWMTTGRGIIHSEMPEPTEGEFHGFQIWLNLPREMKMSAPAYRDLTPEDLLLAESDDYALTLITGEITINGERHDAGQVNQSKTNPVVAHVTAPAGSSVTLQPTDGSRVIVYVFEGGTTELAKQQAGIYSASNVQLDAGPDGYSALVLAGQPLNEPVVQYGPFVMNSVEEIETALREYSAGELTN